ncbi:hypothetical protein BaRGS_00015343 [Batillaria attramentaria]|uniref:Uncharacterized protein n=1 Tax=Batillaria attramentaria TaxID=370345 RepID=A0ABD0L2I9_9CAEN
MGQRGFSGTREPSRASFPMCGCIMTDSASNPCKIFTVPLETRLKRLATCLHRNLNDKSNRCCSKPPTQACLLPNHCGGGGHKPGNTTGPNNNGLALRRH